MPAKDIVSTALLLLGVVLGPAIFLSTVIWYGVTRVLLQVREIREQRYLRSLPCKICQYFTNDDFLQCAVNPCQVMTEEARQCYDFSQMNVDADVNENRSYVKTLLMHSSKLKMPKPS